MNLLPKWALLNPLPVIYDFESVTPLQQTARVYGAMQEMIREYNAFADLINKEMQEFVGSSEEEIGNFKKSVEERIRCKFNDMDATFAKIKSDLVTYTNDYLAKVPALPVVHDTDNEKVVRVIDGVWQAVKLVDDSLARPGMAADAAETGKNIRDIRSRLDNLLGSVTEGSTTLDAEVIDIRLGEDGITYENAGTAVRSQLKNYVPAINHEVSKIISSGHTDSMEVSLKNGVWSASYTYPGETPSYCGTGFALHKTLSQMVGKRILMFFYKIPERPGTINLTKSLHSWSIAQAFKKDTENEWILDVTEDMVEKMGSDDNLFVTFEGQRGIDWSFSCSIYVIDATYDGIKMANLAYYAHHINPDNEVNNAKLASSAGYSYIKANPTKLVNYNSGYFNVDRNAISINVDGYDTSTDYYTLGSFNLKDVKDKLQYIVLEGDPVTDMHLTRSNGSWSNKIKTLSLGKNDLRGLNLADESVVYLTIGQYKPSAPGTWNIRYYLVTDDNVVFATDWLNAPKVNDDIVCWGDSLTAGGGWTSTLATLAGRTVRNAGTGGENARTIMARQGADVMIVNNIIIPADITPVQIATYSNPIKTEFGHNATPLLQGGAHVNPVTIAGVEGTLKWTGSSYSDTSGTWTFTRSEAGESITINRPTAIVTKADREWNDPHLMIVFMGQNGGYNSPGELVQMHRLMMAHAKAKHTVILGLSSGTAASRAEYETAMREAFGRYFISLREYLSKYGLEDAGLTPTAEDTAAMEIGQVPPQLLSDSVHYNAACKTVIGNMLYKKCCELGIF